MGRDMVWAVLLALTMGAGYMSADSAATPAFTKNGELVRPEGYREWIFVGASLGLEYNEDGQPSESKRFHNVYLEPGAYHHYKKTGQFPDKTILMLEILSASSQESIARDGQYEDQFLRLEAAVKDVKRFPERWAYFSFDTPSGPTATTAKAFPKERCWSCHAEHAATDNVFTQFYPLLRR